MSERFTIERDAIDDLFGALRRRNWRLIGPTLHEGAIVYDEIASVQDLPIGWSEVQGPGSYRLERRSDKALFGYNLGPGSWKRYQLPPTVKLWRSPSARRPVRERKPAEAAPSYAFIGARSCELQAMEILQRVVGTAAPDPFIVAVQCAQAGPTCFCASMHTGPVAEQGFDLALTEIIAARRHYFLVEVGSARGAEVLGDVSHAVARAGEIEIAAGVHTRTAAQMGRRLDTDGLRELLYRNYENPRWQEVADRCLTCGNCTMVCPTCFCTSVEDVTDLAGETVERRQHWDSCFTVDYSQIHGGPVRSSARARYRQWMTHKLATWEDQFGSSGCVGCGRCISWCPVGIDLTEEAAVIRASEAEADGDD